MFVDYDVNHRINNGHRTSLDANALAPQRMAEYLRWTNTYIEIKVAVDSNWLIE